MMILGAYERPADITMKSSETPRHHASVPPAGGAAVDRRHALRRVGRAILAIALAIAITTPLAAKEPPHRSWDDLDDDAEKIFGSEKERKYPIHAFIVEKEQWEGHSSCMIGWLYKHTDYPKYRSRRVLPFYYRLESKIDNRTRMVLPFLLYYNRVDGPTERTVTPLFYSDLSDIDADRSLLYLFWWGWERVPEKTRDSSYSALIPLYHYRTYETPGTPNHGWRLITPLLYLRHAASQTGAETRTAGFQVSPLHWYEYRANKTTGTETTTWWAPLIPLTYHHVSPTRGHRNILWLLDYSWRVKDGESSLTRFWIMPLWFYEPGEHGYNAVLPPIYVENRHGGRGLYRHFLPFFIYNREKTTQRNAKEKRVVETHDTYLVTPLYAEFDLYRTEPDGVKTPLASTVWFPIIPLYYSSFDHTEGTHRNVLWLYDTHTTVAGETDRRWLAPLFFWKKESYFHVIPPLYMSWEAKNEKTWFIVNTYYSSERVRSDVRAKTTLAKKDAHPEAAQSFERHTGTLLVLPLFYRGWSEYNAAGEATDVPSHSSETNFFIPLWYYRSFDSTQGGAQRGWARMEERTLVTPLWYYSREFKKCDAPDHPDENESRLWVPLLPILYSHRTDREGSNRTVLVLWDWKTDPKGELTRFWFIPFYFHEYKDVGGYLYVPPFYFRPDGWTEQRGYDFGTFFYRSRSPEEELKWTWLIHYYRSNPGAKDYVNVWFPIYMNWEYADWKAMSVLGPIYMDYEGTEHAWTLFLPAYFNYAAKDGKRKIHINIAGLSKSVTSGANPNVSLGFGKHTSKAGWYIDTEWSWLYDVVSFSTRVTVGAGEKDAAGAKQSEPPAAGKDARQKPSDAPSDATHAHPKPPAPVHKDIVIEDKDSSKPVDKPKEGAVALERKKSIDREDSEFFFGWRMLFGMVAYQRADTRRHFRLLPLSWITWDDKSKDEITWILLYLSYQSEESSYRVVFPFYGSQHEGKSYKQGFLLNLFWREYDAGEDLKEYTVLWPFINWYASPKKRGWRFAPFIWHTSAEDGGERITRTVSPLYYGMDRVRLADGRTVEDFSVSPLHYYNRDDDGTRTERQMFFPIVPLFYHATSTSAPQNSETTAWIFPFFYYNREERPTDAGTARAIMHCSPLHFRSYEESPGSHESTWWFPIIPLVYRSASPGFIHYNVLGIVDYERDEKNEYSRTWLLPLYYNSRSGDEKTSFILGYYSHSKGTTYSKNFLYAFGYYDYPERDAWGWHALFTTVSYDVAPEVKEFRLFWGALASYTAHQNGDYAFDFLWVLASLKREGDRFQSSLMPFWYYSGNPQGYTFVSPALLTYWSDHGDEKFQLVALGALWYRNAHLDRGTDRQMLLLGAPYYFIQRQERGYEERGSLWGILWQHEHERETGYSKFSLLKFLFKRVDMNGDIRYRVFGIELSGGKGQSRATEPAPVPTPPPAPIGVDVEQADPAPVVL